MIQWLLRILGFDSQSAGASESAERPTEGSPVVPHHSPVTATASAEPHIELPEATKVPTPWRHGHVVPSTDVVILRRHIGKHLDALLDEAPAPADRALIARLERLISTDQLDLPPFPDVARELDELLKQTSTDILQIARVVERDPGMVRRVWTHARSAIYSSSPRSLHHAVARVGLDALWRIGMSVCLNGTVFEVQGYQHEADRVRTHGIVTAEVSAGLAGIKRGNLYMAGLLHEVGRLIVLREASETTQEGSPSPEFLERVVDGLRTWLSVLIAASWGLDEEVTRAIAFHYDPEAASSRGVQNAAVVRAASIAAHATALSRAGLAASDGDPSAEIAAVGLDPEKALALAAATMDTLAAAENESPPAAEP